MRDDFGDRAARDELAVQDIDDAVAALGLVHVVRADEDGDAFFAQRMDLFPEIAPRLRIDAGGRFVEKKQLRLVQRAGGKREALFPAARKLLLPIAFGG